MVKGVKLGVQGAAYGVRHMGFRGVTVIEIETLHDIVLLGIQAPRPKTLYPNPFAQTP
jgi:hypothetical protein